MKALNDILSESFKGCETGCLHCGSVNEIASHAKNEFMNQGQQLDEAFARLAAVTSAFLVLQSDATITGGARKLIELECQLMASGKSGSHIITELRNLREENALLLKAAVHCDRLARCRRDFAAMKEIAGVAGDAIASAIVKTKGNKS